MNPYLLIPNILKETSTGLEKYAIWDDMLLKREIECMHEITPESTHSLILQLRYLQSKNPEKEITMYINSPGGDVSSGLALYDVMKAIKCPIRTVCVGLAASMSALLFICGNQRDMLPHARVMIHDPMIMGGITGNALRIDNVSKDLMKIREIAGTIIAQHTGKDLNEVFAKTSTDSYFDANEAVAFGLADKIIYEI